MRKLILAAFLLITSACAKNNSAEETPRVEKLITVTVMTQMGDTLIRRTDIVDWDARGNAFWFTDKDGEVFIKNAIVVLEY